MSTVERLEILEAGARAIGVQHEGGGAQRSVHKLFRAENHSDGRLLCGVGELPAGALQKFRIRWRRLVAQSTIAARDGPLKLRNGNFLNGRF